MSTPRSFLDQLHASHCRRSRPLEHWRGFAVEWVDLRRMKLALGGFVPFVWYERSAADSGGTSADLVAFAREKASSGPVVFLDAEPSMRRPSDEPLGSLWRTAAPRLGPTGKRVNRYPPRP